MSEGWTPNNGSKWGLTMQEFLTLRGTACPLCRKRYNRANRPAVVDHDHTSGEIRGIICRQCNELLGVLKERDDWMEQAARWLRGRHPEGTRWLLTERKYAPGSPGAAGLEVTK